MKVSSVFHRQLVAWGVSLAPGAEDRLYRFARLLCAYDRANVLGTRDFDRVLLEHVLDALSCLLFPPVEHATTVADIGSGGGLPGIPLAIALPEARFTLLESTGKKAAFLRYATGSLDLTNVEVANARVEAAAHEPARRATQDLCTVRAVAKLPVLAEYCLPLLKAGGHAVAMKAHVSDEEYAEGERAARLLGGSLLAGMEVPLLPELRQKARRLVVLKKTAETPAAYPRRVGLPARSPLGQK